MRHRQFSALGLVVVAMLALSIGSAHAQTTAVGPYYATPSWDQKLACSSTSNCPRFVVLSNWSSAAVLDRETGLVWEKSPDSTLRTWPAAMRQCNELSKSNRKGWRLPTLQDLTSLVDPSVVFPGPALPAGHPFDNVQWSAQEYWSATSFADFPTGAWSVGLATGNLRSDTKGAAKFVWCVRGGQGSDAQ
jgi:hypothetical protein